LADDQTVTRMLKDTFEGFNLSQGGAKEYGDKIDQEFEINDLSDCLKESHIVH
jgi:hypothetical protein